VTGTLVDPEHPYVAHGPWLQVLIPDDLAQVMSDSFEVFNNPEEVSGHYEYQTSRNFIFVGCILLRYTVTLSKYTCNRP
jgi:hypothetical protein